MNKKLLISLGLVMALSATVISAMAEESAIYTDDLGRLHFLGKGVAQKENKGYNNAVQSYGNGPQYDSSYREHPVKNYDYTFGADRLDTQSIWKNRFTNNVDEAQVGTPKSNKAEYNMEKTYLNDVNPYYTNTTTNTEENKKAEKKAEKKAAKQAKKQAKAEAKANR